MKVSQFVFVSIGIVLWFAAVPVTLATGGDHDPRLEGRMEEKSSGFGGGGGGTQGPPVVLPLGGTQVQMVGFAVDGHTGDSGLLAFHQACGRAYLGSRTCTVAEIHQTMKVPAAPEGFRFAWIEPDGQDGHSAKRITYDTRGRLGAETPGDTVDRATDCQGWTSAGNQDAGMAIDLGNDGCYGGFFLVPCAERLAIACCAPIDTTLTSAD